MTIRVHAEKRDESVKQSMQPKQNKQNSFKKNFKINKHGKADKKEKNYPSHIICDVCEGNHPTYACDGFRSLNLLGRKNTACEKGLCVRCLRKNHDGQCEVKRCNNECPRCKPEIKFHNSLLCPNGMSTVLMAQAGSSQKSRKRTYENRGKKNNQSNKRQKRETATNMQSSIFKVGDWSLAAHTNALARVNDKMQNKEDERFQIQVQH